MGDTGLSCHGLYAVVDTGLIPEGELVDRAARALRGGARLVQYRDKSRDAARREVQARALQELCATRGASLIINDDPMLASVVGAAGVHVGRDDPDIDAVRHIAGTGVAVGMSCYNDLERALRAERAGADYVAFGSMFPSPTKPAAVAMSLSRLREARRRLRLPIVAIGGITIDNVADVVAAGADAIAVISALFASPDIEQTARRFAASFPPVQDRDARR